jgi:hypothetical protein
MAGLTIDAGRYLHERRVRQNAADAAALAGASELPGSPDAAIAEARSYVLAHGFASSDIESITVSSRHVRDDTMNVKLKSPFSWGLASVLSLANATVGADAGASVGSPAATAGLSPWGVLESAVDWSGGSTVLKYDATNPTNGNFGILAIDGTGSSIYQDTIENGSDAYLCAQGQPGCVDPTATTQTGNKVGATRDGIEYLMDNTSSSCDSFGEVFFPLPDGTYAINGGCNPWGGADDSKRLILIPVISSFCNGSCDVTVLYFAAFFLESLGQCTGNECELTGQFVKVVADPNSIIGAFDQTPNAIKLVRLVY